MIIIILIYYLLPTTINNCTCPISTHCNKQLFNRSCIECTGSFVLNEMKKTTNLETNLHALDKYTNYSVRILAYTKVGEGVQSNPVYCLTEQDGKSRS